MDHRDYLAQIGRKGGSVRSAAKAEAARKNGTAPKRITGRWAYEVIDGTPRRPMGYVGTVDTRAEALTLRATKCRMGGYIKRVRIVPA